MKASAVKLFKGKHPEAENCWCALAPAPEAGHVPWLALDPQGVRDGWADGWRQSPGGRVQRNKAGFAKLSAEPLPCSPLPPCPEARKCDCLKCHRTWPRNAQSSGSAVKQSAEGFALLAEELACRDHASDHI